PNTHTFRYDPHGRREAGHDPATWATLAQVVGTRIGDCAGFPGRSRSPGRTGYYAIFGRAPAALSHSLYGVPLRCPPPGRVYSPASARKSMVASAHSFS